MVTLKLRVITHIYEIKNVKISKTKHGKYKKISTCMYTYVYF